MSKTDEFGRVAASGVYQGNSTPLDSAAVVTSYSYDLPGCKTSSRVERMSIANAAEANSFYKDYFYSYDELGNILTVSEGGVQKARYEYDEASQLIRVDDAQQNLSFTYNYDAGGNILNKKTYAYTTGTLGASTDSIDYGYTDTNWKDKMTSYDGSAITYDASGNPLTYDGWEFEWEGERQFKGMSKTGEGTLAFDYDSNGIRTSKTVNSTVTTFTVVGSQITRQQTGENNMYFFYDNDGQLIGLNYADVNYFYVKNLQGDIVAIADIDGNIVVEYTYDAWGNLLSTSGTLAGTLGNDNPFRYRGYYYDAEIDLYYLQSRYYCPEWGRFVNADGDAFIDGTSVFAYCGNNPINAFDPSGYYPSLNTLQYYTMNWLFENNTPRNWRYIPFRQSIKFGGYVFPNTKVDNYLKYQTYGIDGRLNVFVNAYNMYTNGPYVYNFYDINHDITILCLPVTNWLIRINNSGARQFTIAAKAVFGSQVVEAALTVLSGAVAPAWAATTGQIGEVIAWLCSKLNDNIFLNKELKAAAKYIAAHPDLLSSANTKNTTYIVSLSRIITKQYNWRTSSRPTWTTSFTTGPFIINRYFY